MNHLYIIGAGGVGSFLCPVLCKLAGHEHLTVIDKDLLEEKNLDRQLFPPSMIGASKAEALASTYQCEGVKDWFFDGLIELSDTDWLLVCVDNHPARKAALESCDHYGCRAIIGGNETTSAEALYYHPDWRGGPLDPRSYYPEIKTATAGDPMRASAGCTGQAQEQNRQLVTANFMAAALMGHLFVVWALESTKLNKEARQHLPFHLTQNLSQNQTRKVIEYVKEN
jgi:molybdopterin/thiamine biosynthesis adenylyltransferase